MNNSNQLFQFYYQNYVRPEGVIPNEQLHGRHPCVKRDDEKGPAHHHIASIMKGEHQDDMRYRIGMVTTQNQHNSFAPIDESLQGASQSISNSAYTPDKKLNNGFPDKNFNNNGQNNTMVNGPQNMGVQPPMGPHMGSIPMGGPMGMNRGPPMGGPMGPPMGQPMGPPMGTPMGLNRAPGIWDHLWGYLEDQALWDQHWERLW